MGFCPSCGKKTESGFCEDCRPVSELKIKDITFKVCAACNRYFYKNKWDSGSLDSGVTRIVRDAIKDSEASVTFDLPALKGPGLSEDFEIEIIKDKDTFTVPAKLTSSYCEPCSRKQGKYFEGTLQLRKVNDEVLDFIENYVKQNGFFVADKKETKDGYDLDISNQKKLQTLGQQLKKTFGGTLKVSIRQFTHNRLTSKQVYRVNVYYEAPPYKKGDVVVIDEKAYLLTNVRKTVTAIDLKLDRKITLDVEGKSITMLPKTETRVTKNFPNLEVMDPETFQSTPTRNKMDCSLNEKVKVVNFEGVLYIVP